MWRYLKAAFLVGVTVPGLGRLPVNALGAAAIGILGFVEPSIWLAGLGLEAAVVSALAFNPRFQRVVEAQQGQQVLESESTKRAALIAVLPPDLRQRLANLQNTSSRILAIYKTQGIDPEFLDGTQSSLEKLQWIHLKLLIARHHLASELGVESPAQLETRIRNLQQAASQPNPTPALQRSQQATLEILERRLQNLKNRDKILLENESDLNRIEAQVELMRENAAIEGKPTAVDTEIELASDLAAPDLFGSHLSLVRELDAVRR